MKQALVSKFLSYGRSTNGARNAPACSVGHRPDLAAKYVCIWEPPPSDTDDTNAEAT
jgi:hypothetical protein